MGITATFQSEHEAARSGYVLAAPETIEHRRWIIISEFSRDKLKVWGREVSQSVDRGTIYFRTTKTLYPRADLIRIVGRISRVGHPIELIRRPRTSEWMQAVDAIESLIDRAVDGDEDLDNEMRRRGRRQPLARTPNQSHWNSRGRHA